MSLDTGALFFSWTPLKSLGCWARGASCASADPDIASVTIAVKVRNIIVVLPAGLKPRPTASTGERRPDKVRATLSSPRLSSPRHVYKCLPSSRRCRRRATARQRVHHDAVAAFQVRGDDALDV